MEKPARSLTTPPSPDETEIARRRMKHLVPWRIEPVPAVHVAARSYGAPAPLTGEARERCKRIALNVLALQMVAAAGSGRTPAEAPGT